tara:strand:+ start:9785 stop:12358 length:2574 start_codon:yes stop_codon:yes gene_type:complete
MSNKLFYSSPRARFLDTNGDPLTFGRVSFYEAGTTTLKTIYTDSENSIPTPNPFLLDAEGYVVDGGVWMGAGKYKMKLEKALVIPPDILEDGDFSELWTIDNIVGSTQLNSGELSTVVVGTISDLRGLTAGEYSLVYVAGYWEVNDGGGGWFNYDSNGFETDNGGTIISPNGSPQFGRYYRNLENWETSVQYFGATSTATSVVDAYVQNCLTWCLANAQTMVFPSDEYTFGATQTYQGDLTIRIKENAVFNGEIPIELHLEPQNLEVEGVTNHLGTDLVLYLAPVVPNSFRPEHWGAVGGTNNDLDWQGFANADGRYSDSTLILSANYKPFIPAGSLATQFSIQKAHLLKRGSLESDANVSLGEYTFEEGTNTFWLFDIINLGTYSMNKLYLDHFKNFTSLADADFVVLADAVTNTNTRHGTLQLLTGGVYSVNTISALGAYSLDLYIKTGNSIKAVGASNLPRLLNNVGDFGILDNTGDTIKLQGDKHSVLWWGASSSTNSATTNLGITKAIASASLSTNLGFVTGNNENLSMVSVDLTIINPNLELRDFKFSNTSGFGIIFLSGVIKCFNCALTGVKGTVGGTYSFDSCEITGDSDTDLSANIIEVSRCSFNMNSSNTLKLNGFQELYYEGNRSSNGRFDFTTGSSTNVISNNRFNGLVRIGAGTADQSIITINGGSNTTITGNATDGVDNQAVVASTYVIDFVGTAQVVSNLVCKGNSFGASVVGAGQQWRGIFVAGYATDGHSANVTENLTSSDFFDCAQTTRNVQQVLATSVTQSSSVPLIFPFYSAQTYAWVMGTSESAVMLTTGVNQLGIHITSVTASGGNATVNYDYRIEEAGVNNANMKFSLQETRNL